MKKWPILCFFLLSGLFADAQKWQFGTDLFSQRKVFFDGSGRGPSFFETYQPVRGDLMVNYLLKKNWAVRAKIDPVERWKDEFDNNQYPYGSEKPYRGWRTSLGIEKGWKIGRFKPFIFADLELATGKIKGTWIYGGDIEFGPDRGPIFQTNKKINENLGFGLEFYLSKRFSLRAESAFQNSFGWIHLSDGAGEHDFKERSFKFWWLNSFGAFVRF